MNPTVTIIVPCYNEKLTIRHLLEAIAVQDYSHELMEVVIADGLSQDGTREVIQEFRAGAPSFKLSIVDNPQRIIPAGLNHAIRAANGEIILRLDAHSVPAPDYVSRCVEALVSGKGENVGGIWEIRPSTGKWLSRSIAAAAAHPIGVGDAFYRHTTRPAYVDTVPFGCFKRDLVDRVGWFDETLLTNEDYEFNTRIRNSGGKIWLDPAIRAVYFSRATLSALARQYWRYGFWKFRMLKRYPGSLRWRQALPPVFALSLIIGALLSWIPVVSSLLLIEFSVYTLVLASAGVISAIKSKDGLMVLGVPLAIATMHLSWGLGFLWSMIRWEGS